LIDCKKTASKAIQTYVHLSFLFEKEMGPSDSDQGRARGSLLADYTGLILQSTASPKPHVCATHNGRQT